jgi:hypothetical protein
MKRAKAFLVVETSAKPFVYFDSEYKGRECRELRRLSEADRLGARERAILESYRGTPIFDCIRRHPESW